MTFAVIKTGGKQYKVAEGDTVRIEKLQGEYKEGDTVTFDEVLLVDSGKDTTLGTPTVKGSKVAGTIAKIGRSKKVTGVKYKPKSRYRVGYGHRQHFFDVTIDSVK